MTEGSSEVGSGVKSVDLGSVQGLGAASDDGSQATRAQTVAGAMDARVGSPARDQAASIGAVTDLDEIFRDFNDPRRKWRRLLAEFVGTFFLVLVAAGAPMMNVTVDGSVSRLAAVVGYGLRGRGGGWDGSTAAQGTLAQGRPRRVSIPEGTGHAASSSSPEAQTQAGPSGAS